MYWPCACKMLYLVAAAKSAGDNFVVFLQFFYRRKENFRSNLFG